MLELPKPSTNRPPAAVGDSQSVPREVLELRVAELRQIFNAMDPAPFYERDLDATAVAYILDWGRDTDASRPLGLRVHLGREPVTAENTTLLRDAIRAYFAQRALSTRRQLRQLFRIGRISLLIGLVFLCSAIVIGEFIADLLSRDSYSSFIRESFVIGGWVALWRPLEIFLYDWWPLRAEAKLQDRLSAMDVHVLGLPAGQLAGDLPSL